MSFGWDRAASTVQDARGVEMFPGIGDLLYPKGHGGRLLPIRKYREERENGIASAVPFSHFSIDAVTFDISKAPMPL